VARHRDALFVPSQALLDREGKRWVYRVTDGRAHLVPVKVGESNWQSTEILEGLGEGDQVVINLDTPGLTDGARVRVP
jgi:HlyD family secretion protein